MRDQSRDLLLLLPVPGRSVNAEVVREMAGGGATVVAAWVPEWDHGFRREDFLRHYLQCGVDLEQLEPLRLRDLVLVQRSQDHVGSAKALLAIYNSDSSHYDIDAVRIPWDCVATPRDPRNNPQGKNPTNIWDFAEEKRARGSSLFPDERTSQIDKSTTCGLPGEAIIRLVRAHCHPKGKVYVWADSKDWTLIKSVVLSVSRNCERLPEGPSDPVRIVPQPEDEDVSLDGTVAAKLVWDRDGVRARAVICDNRVGLKTLEQGSVTHVVTSPPYNIGYRPFNVPRPSRNGALVDPGRASYEDELEPNEYQTLLRTTLAAIDRVASSRLDVFLNVKNSYADATCIPPFYMLSLMPTRWKLKDVIIWEYDISYDPAPKKYKPLYEWVLRVGFGKGLPPRRAMETWYVPILKGNSGERRGLVHPAIFPADLVARALDESKARPGDLVVDPFLGSGTTLSVALDRGIESVGFERSDAFIDDIKTRMGKARLVSQSKGPAERLA